MGGSPTSSVKRRASVCARDPGRGGERADRPGPRRVVVQKLQCPADERVRVRGVPGRRLTVRPGEPGAQSGDQQQVEQPVQHGLLAGLVAAQLGGEQRRDRRVPLEPGEGRAPAVGRAAGTPTSPSSAYAPVRSVVDPCGSLPHVRTPSRMASARWFPSASWQSPPGPTNRFGTRSGSSATM